MFGVLLMSIVTIYFLICAIKYFKRKESWLGWYTFSAFGFFAMIHDFVSDRLDEVKDDYNKLGFIDASDMLNQIKNNFSIALWALNELLWWGLKENYTKKYFIVSEYDFDSDTPSVYIMQDSLGNNIYFSIGKDETGEVSIIEMEPITVTITKWITKKANKE